MATPVKIDSEELNFLHNRLRDLVGEGGTFVLFLENGDDVQIRFVGSDVRVTGLLASCDAYVREHLRLKFRDRMKRLPTEPD